MFRTVLINGLEYWVDTSNDLIVKRRGGGYVKSFPDKDGYLKYAFSINGRTHNISVHRFVWEIHKGVIPDGYTVDHKDNNKLNNGIENLQLLTAKDNVIKGNAREWTAVAPSGAIFKTYNMSQFCRDHGLNRSHMYETAKEFGTKHKGWYCYE